MSDIADQVHAVDLYPGVLSRSRRIGVRRAAVAAAGSVAVVIVAAGVALAVRPARDGGQPVAPGPAPTVVVPSSTPDPGLSQTSGPTETSGRPPGSGPLTSVPAAAMLTTADLPGYTQSGDGQVDGDWSFHSTSTRCPGTYPTLGVYRDRGFTAGRDISVIERVHLVTNGAAHLAGVRQVVRGCPELSVVAERFTADDAVLVQSVHGVQWVIFREGNTVIEIFIKPSKTADDAIRLAQRARTRLCGALPQTC